MNILFLAPRFHTNQVDLISKLIEKGHRISFIVMRQGPTEDYSQLIPYVVGPSWFGKSVNRFAKRPIPFLGSTHGLPDLVRLYRGIITSRPDVAIIRDIRSGYGLFSLPFLLLRGTRVVVYTQRPKYEQDMMPYLRLLYFILFKVMRFRGFTPVKYKVTSPDSSKTNTPLQFIPFCKHISFESRSRTFHTREPRLLAVGKFEPRKNFMLLLDTFTKLLKKYRCTLTLVSECSSFRHRQYYDKVKLFIEENSLQTKVRLLVDQPYQNMKWLYMDHDIFIMPSSRETASISQIEAMAHGLPVVCSDDNGTAHYVKHNVNGFIVKADSDSLYKAIACFLENPKIIQSFGVKSVELLETEFNIEKVYEKFLHVIS